MRETSKIQRDYLHVFLECEHFVLEVHRKTISINSKILVTYMANFIKLAVFCYIGKHS